MGGKMSIERNELISALCITLDDSDRAITEKLFCAALTTLNTVEIARVLKEYNRLKMIMQGDL